VRSFADANELTQLLDQPVEQDLVTSHDGSVQHAASRMAISELIQDLPSLTNFDLDASIPPHYDGVRTVVA
jgi:hypothetical protein